jgi:hypothetical protein
MNPAILVHRALRATLLSLWVAAACAGLLVNAGPVRAEMSELEAVLRAKIDMGEAMGRYMREQRASGRSMDDYDQMATEINAMVAEILGGYGLTIEEYRARSPQLLADEAAVDTFLNTHPDLKQRYEALPQRPPSGSSGRP